MPFIKNGQEITNFEEWEDHAGVRERHWQPGRSAMELAIAWLASSPRMPPVIEAAFSDYPDFLPVTKWSAEPEARLRIDEFRGMPPNIDLFITAEDDEGPWLIVIEAKADESFGQLVAKTLADAVEKKLKNPQSNGVERVEHLVAHLFGPRRPGEAPLDTLRYQLLTATAAALMASRSRGGLRVVLLIQEFTTTRTKDGNHIRNAHDLDNFVDRFSHGVVGKIEPGRIYGPIAVPTGSFSHPATRFYIGKVTHNLRQP